MGARRYFAANYERLPDKSVVRLAQAGDRRACEYLLYKYRGLIRTKIRPFYLVGGERDDLIQIGMIGLWQSILDYSSAKRISFLSFARICIERHVISAIKTATRQKQSPLNTAVSIEYYAQESEGDFSLTDILVSEVDIDPEILLLHKEEKKIMRGFLRELLSQFEWEVLKQYYLGKTYREIAHGLACSTKSVDNALGRIKRKMSTRSRAFVPSAQAHKTHGIAHSPASRPRTPQHPDPA